MIKKAFVSKKLSSYFQYSFLQQFPPISQFRVLVLGQELRNGTDLQSECLLFRTNFRMFPVFHANSQVFFIIFKVTLKYF